MGYYDPPEDEGFDLMEQFGTIEIKANLFGFHLSSDTEPILLDADQAENVADFIKQWMPRVQAAKTPNCPTCRTELQTENKEEAVRWSCKCGRHYKSGPFGGALAEINDLIQQTHLLDGAGDEIDFLGADDLP